MLCSVFKCIARFCFYSAFFLYNLDFILLWNIVLMPSVLYVLPFSIVTLVSSNISCKDLSYYFIIMFSISPVEIQCLCKVRYGLHWAHAPKYTQYYLLTYLLTQWVDRGLILFHQTYRMAVIWHFLIWYCIWVIMAQILMVVFSVHVINVKTPSGFQCDSRNFQDSCTVTLSHTVSHMMVKI